MRPAEPLASEPAAADVHTPEFAAVSTERNPYLVTGGMQEAINMLRHVTGTYHASELDWRTASKHRVWFALQMADGEHRMTGYVYSLTGQNVAVDCVSGSTPGAHFEKTLTPRVRHTVPLGTLRRCGGDPTIAVSFTHLPTALAAAPAGLGARAGFGAEASLPHAGAAVC